MYLKIIFILTAFALLFSNSNELKSQNSDNLIATISTEKGDIKLELYGDKTPLTVGSFVNLARRGFYDGLKFHRVVEDFMIQGGCPLGTGTGNPGYKFEDETRADLKHSGPGILSMANSGPNTNGSQFFITHKNTSWLDGGHTVFGKVIEGMNIVNSIKKGDKINSITITGDIPKEMKEIQPRIDEFNKILDKIYPKLKPAEKF